MESNRKLIDGEFDFDNLPEGVYFFSGQEGFVKVKVDKDGNQSWDLKNWYATLDPDNNEEQDQKIIQDINKKREKIEDEINQEMQNAEKEIIEQALNDFSQEQFEENLFEPEIDDVCFDKNSVLGKFENIPEQKLAIPAYKRKNIKSRINKLKKEFPKII